MNAQIGIALAGTILLAASGRSQTVPEAGSRALWDSEFLRQRPASKATRTARPEVPQASTTPREPVPQPLGGALVGLTVWRLRRSTPADESGALGLLHSEKGDRVTLKSVAGSAGIPNGGLHMLSAPGIS
jgi:hypothetical protein